MPSCHLHSPHAASKPKATSRSVSELSSLATFETQAIPNSSCGSLFGKVRGRGRPGVGTERGAAGEPFRTAGELRVLRGLRSLRFGVFAARHCFVSGVLLLRLANISWLILPQGPCGEHPAGTGPQPKSHASTLSAGSQAKEQKPTARPKLKPSSPAGRGPAGAGQGRQSLLLQHASALGTVYSLCLVPPQESETPRLRSGASPDLHNPNKSNSKRVDPGWSRISRCTLPMQSRSRRLSASNSPKLRTCNRLGF